MVNFRQECVREDSARSKLITDEEELGKQVRNIEVNAGSVSTLTRLLISIALPCILTFILQYHDLILTL